jgi:hypothetical protein
MGKKIGRQLTSMLQQKYSYCNKSGKFKQKKKNNKLAQSKLKSEKPKHKISEIQTTKKMLFCLDFAVLKFGFPRFFRKSKFKQKISSFLWFGFHRF